MGCQFELTDEKVRPVLSMRVRTAAANLPQEFGRVYGAIIQYLGEIGETTEGPAFGAYYNLDMENLDLEIGFILPKEIPGKGEIQEGSIPGGRQVSYLYKGAYEEMEPVYNAMAEWMSEQGLEPTGVAYEFYYNSPAEVPVSELLTKIMFPLK
jgi:effector-binding domain-containing protein